MLFPDGSRPGGSDAGDDRIALVERLSAAFAAELARREDTASIGWPNLPDVAALADHVGGVERWVVRVLRSGRVQPDEATRGLRGEALRRWYAEGRVALLSALAAVPADGPCWVLGRGTPTAGFWRRRMVHEHLKHLIDLRASGGAVPEVAEEAGPAVYADGIDELLEVFLPRSRSALTPLPGPLVLEATDSDRAWRIAGDWTCAVDFSDAADARVRARTGDLALMVWERADPLRDADRFRVEGDREVVAAFRSAPIHPW